MQNLLNLGQKDLSSDIGIDLTTLAVQRIISPPCLHCQQNDTNLIIVTP